jgi:hypothetical protein
MMWKLTHRALGSLHNTLWDTRLLQLFHLLVKDGSLDRPRICLSALRPSGSATLPVQIRVHIYGWQVGAPLVCAGKIGCSWLLEYRASCSKRLIRRGMTSNPMHVSEPSTSMRAGSGSRMPVAGEKPMGSLEEIVGRSAAPRHSVALRRGYP